MIKPLRLASTFISGDFMDTNGNTMGWSRVFPTLWHLEGTRRHPSGQWDYHGLILG